MADLSWGGYDWSTVEAGQKLIVYLTPDMSEGWSQIRLGNGSWGALPGTSDANPLAADDTRFAVTLTQAMIDEMVAAKGFRDNWEGQGVNYISDRLVLEDMHPANVFIDALSKKPICIDCIVKFVK